MNQGVHVTTTTVTDIEGATIELSGRSDSNFSSRKMDRGLSVDLKRPSYDPESRGTLDVKKIVIGDGLSLRSFELDADSLRHGEASVDLEAQTSRTSGSAPVAPEPVHSTTERRKELTWRDML